MSLNRQFYNDFRPLYGNSFEDPFTSAFDPYSLVPRQRSGDRTQSNAAQRYSEDSMFSNSGGPATRSPNVHLSDEGDYYHVEAEVPGIRRENLDVSIGDNGRSLTIRGGAAVSGSVGGDTLEETEGEATSPSVGKSTRGTTSTTEYTETVTTSSSQGGERQPVQRWTSRSSFARTMWLPRPVDSQGVKATLDHGVLTLEIPKLSAQNHRITIG
ncbi:hypothetical protein FRC00_009251 [Tulasnella sp. 408]|nr:hypothetical protein FRC00_009251 [Tulasnella sp. 408]